jgi:hypothetical protein
MITALQYAEIGKNDDIERLERGRETGLQKIFCDDKAKGTNWSR